MRQINNVQGESGGVRVRRKLVRIDGAVKRGNQEREAPQRVCMKGFSQFGSAMGDKGQCL